MDGGRDAAPDGAFGTRLRSLREAAGLSQEDLAERAGLSSHAVSALERGTRTRPYPHTVRALATALGCTEAERAALVAAVPSRRATGAPEPSVGTVRPRPGLPTPPGTLLGREADLARIQRLLEAHRVLTLTGTGGVGKTRLALAVAGRLREQDPDAVVYVELAPLRHAEAVLPAVLDALGAGPAGDDPMAALVAGLGGRRVLLVLDNLEHLLAAAPTLAALVGAAPELRLLVTSRAPLRIRGELEVPVDPLPLPDGPDDLEAPAARLLLERAGATSRGWGRAPGDGAPVAELCRRLAGIPLALELAAARARLLGPAALLDRLDDALLAGGRDLPERQRTMRATLDWSYGLLAAEEQALLRLLAAFVGGFRLEDVERVAEQSGLLPAPAVLAAMEALVEHSLVLGRDTPHGRRHLLLEPVAQYARGRSEEAGDWDTAVAAHADHFLDLVEGVAPHYRDGAQIEALARIDAEHPNVTAAMRRLAAGGEHDRVGRYGWALWMYWWLRGHHGLGRRLVEPALAHPLPAGVQARAELAAATMCFAMDDVEAARGWWARATEHAGDDPVAAANAVAGTGLADLAQGDLVAAAERFAAAVPLAEAGGAEGDWTWALSHVWSGTVAMLSGDPDGAVARTEVGLASARRRGDRLTAYIALYNLSQVELARGRPALAREHLVEGMRLTLETADHANLAYLLDALAVLEAAEDRHARVPLLLGAAQAIREDLGAFGYGYYRPEPGAVEAAAVAAASVLGTDRYDDALDVGRGLPPPEAARLALARPGD